MLLVPYAHAGVCCVCVSFGVGMDTEGVVREAQLAHYVEHIVATFDAAESTRLERLAVAHNASTDGDVTSFYAAGETESVCGVWLRALGAAVREPDVRDDRLVKEAMAATTELKMAAQDPAVRLAECIARVEAPHSHECSIEQQIAYTRRLAHDPSAARRALSAFMAAHYRPGRAHVTVVAHSDSHARIAASVARYFAHDPPVLRARHTARVPGFRYGETHVVYRADVDTAHVAVRVAMADTARPYAAWAAARIINRSAQRLLRETLGSIYHVSVRPVFLSRNEAERSSGVYRAWMELSCQCAHEHVRAVTELAVTRAFECRATDEDVDGWKATERMRPYTHPESIMETAQRCAHADMLGLPALGATELVEELQRVGAACVRRVSASLRASVRMRRFAVYVVTRT
jgi:predicted Zn-dependent peptidase